MSPSRGNTIVNPFKEDEVKDIGGAVPVEVALWCAEVLGNKNEIKDIHYAISIALLCECGGGRGYSHSNTMPL